MTAASPPPLQFNNGRFLIQAAGATDVGQVRSHNEDHLGLLPEPLQPLAAERGYLFAVADGMGGAEKGEVASERAIVTLFDAYYQGELAPSPEAGLRRSFETANAVVFEEGQQLNFGMMGTTLVACVVAGDAVLIGNVGDSRAYLLRGGTLTQLTEDHSWVQDQVRAGMLTPEEALVSPQRNIITRAIGHQALVDVALYPLTDVQPGDILLLCSDGLHGMLNDAALAQVEVDADLAASARRFVDLANAAGGHDNITCLLVRFLAPDGTLARDPAHTLTMRPAADEDAPTQPRLQPVPPLAPVSTVAPATGELLAPAEWGPPADEPTTAQLPTQPPVTPASTPPPDRPATAPLPARPPKSQGRRIGGLVAAALALIGIGAVVFALFADRVLSGSALPATAPATAAARPTTAALAAAAPTAATAPIASPAGTSAPITIAGKLSLPTGASPRSCGFDGEARLSVTGPAGELLPPVPVGGDSSFQQTLPAFAPPGDYILHFPADLACTDESGRDVRFQHRPTTQRLPSSAPIDLQLDAVSSVNPARPEPPGALRPSGPLGESTRSPGS